MKLSLPDGFKTIKNSMSEMSNHTIFCSLKSRDTLDFTGGWQFDWILIKFPTIKYVETGIFINFRGIYREQAVNSTFTVP